MGKKCKKRKHPSQGKARHESDKMSVRFGVPYSYYLCSNCKKWHVGRAEKNKVAEIKRKLLMKNIAVIGIDPGKTGALTLICGSYIEVHDFEGVYDAFKLISALNRKFEVKFAIIEKVWFQPQERDVKAAEVLIRNAAMWETLLLINRIPYEKYSPATWRKNFIPKNLRTKKGYLSKAKRMWTEHEDLFTRHDRAESALIAHRALLHAQSGMPVTKHGMVL